MKKLSIPPEVQTLLDQEAPVAVGVSGGKDSHAVAWALSKFLKGYEGPKVLIHSDLGDVEWLDSLPACQRIADRIGWELITTRRKAGGMMERWESRWQSSIRRYCAMETVAVVLPWSTPAMRFCTSELKVDPITSTLKKRYGKVPIINVTGVRAEESTARAKQPVCSSGAKLPPNSLAWRPIHEWLLQDVWDAIEESGVPAHEAYDTFGSTRVSCRFCILANEADLRASLKDPAAIAIYRRMCELELESGFAFQGSRWLTSLAPELLSTVPGGYAPYPYTAGEAWYVGGSARLGGAQLLAAQRQEVEAWIPKHLRFSKGWPHCVPTSDEAEKLAKMRREIGRLYGWKPEYVTGPDVLARYEELMEIKAEKAAKKK